MSALPTNSERAETWEVAVLLRRSAGVNSRLNLNVKMEVLEQGEFCDCDEVERNGTCLSVVPERVIRISADFIRDHAGCHEMAVDGEVTHDLGVDVGEAPNVDDHGDANGVREHTFVPQGMKGGSDHLEIVIV